MTLPAIIALVLGAACLVNAGLLFLAPSGYQDDAGFHLGEPDA